MNRTKFWPFGALIVLAVAVIAAIVAAMLFKYQGSAKASALPNAARIARVDGQVGVNQSNDNSANAQWIQATTNMPVSAGDRIYTKQNSKTDLAFTGRNFATIDPNTSLDVLDLSENRTQLALREGSAMFDVGSIPSGGLFEVATPCGAVDLQQPGLYQVAINEAGNATATAYSGAAQIVGQYGSGQIQKGESLAVSCEQNTPAVISRVEPNQAGPFIDSYYRYRYPKRYDGRYQSYYTYLDDPYYYDPARSYNSYNYVSDYIPGVDDLDDYGQWQNVSGYGYCWHPNEYAGWSPYQAGFWEMDNPYGLTWVSSEPWGYAPYHYGRWAYASNDWYWVPESVNTYPAYSPALVAFLPIGDSSVGWVALGPSDPYVTRYYDPYWQPSYVYPSNVVVERVVNVNVPGAVTVIPVQDFSRPIDRTVITTVDPQLVTRARPVLDPLTIDPVKRAAFQTQAARRRVDVPREIQERVSREQVIATAAPAAPPFRRDLARSFNVQPLTDRARNQKLQLSDQRNQTAPPAAQTNVSAEQARERQMADLARQAARGNESARQQMRQLQQQQPAQPLAGVRARAQAQAQPQGERVGQPAQIQREMIRQQQQAQREAARQQMITSQQQRRAAEEQTRTQRQQTQRAIRNVPSAQPRVIAPPPHRIERSSTQGQTRRSPQAQPQPRPALPPKAQAQPRAVAPQVERRVAPPMRVPEARPQPQVVRPQPQAQPRPQVVQPKPQAQPRPGKPPEQKGSGKKKPGGQ